MLLHAGDHEGRFWVHVLGLPQHAWDPGWLQDWGIAVVWRPCQDFVSPSFSLFPSLSFSQEIINLKVLFSFLSKSILVTIQANYIARVTEGPKLILETVNCYLCRVLQKQEVQTISISLFQKHLHDTIAVIDRPSSTVFWGHKLHWPILMQPVQWQPQKDQGVQHWSAGSSGLHSINSSLLRNWKTLE